MSTSSPPSHIARIRQSKKRLRCCPVKAGGNPTKENQGCKLIARKTTATSPPPPPPPPEIFLLHSIGTRYIWHSIRNRINKHNCGMILTYRVSCPELQLPDWVESVCATMQSSGQKLRSLPGLTGVSAAVCHVAIWPFGNAAADSKWLTISNSPFSCPAYQSGFSLASNILVNSVTLGDGRRWEEVGGDEYNGDASSPSPPLPTI